MMDESHDPTLQSWVESANDGLTDFPIQNLALGIFSTKKNQSRRVGMAIGDEIVDLAVVHAAGMLSSFVVEEQLAAASLEPLLNEGSAVLRMLRRRMSELLATGRSGNPLRERRDQALVAQADCRMHRPTTIPNFSDFYAGIEHARRAGSIARPGSALGANYASQPLGYHSRASTVRISGEPVARPAGPRPLRSETILSFGHSAALDFELELGCFVCGLQTTDRSLKAQAWRVGGLCLLNDWSARDLQRWEMAHQGPFIGKSFATTISPWLVTLDALAPFRIPAMARDPDHPPLLDYLRDEVDRSEGAFDIDLSVTLRTATMRANGECARIITLSNARHLYWTFAQMITHHSVNGCDLVPGDLIGSGTISGPTDPESGSLLELTADGLRPIALPHNELRGYLEDGDEVNLRGRCTRDGFVPIGFGSCSAIVLPGRPL